MEDWDGEMSSNELQGHVDRFEETLKNGEHAYFDVYVLEKIIDFLIERNQHKKARAAIEIGHELHPNSTGLRIKEAMFYLHFGKLSKAAELLKDLEQLVPNNEQVIIMIAQLYSHRKDHRRSINYFLRAANMLSEAEPELFIDLAMEYQNVKEYGNSIHYLKKVLKISPRHETALHEIAYCYDIMQDIEGAIAFMTKQIDKDPYNDLAWFLLASNYIKNIQISDALHALDYCTLINPKNSAAWYTKGHCHQELDETSAALQCYLECLKFDLPQAEIHTVIGECYEEMDLLSEAEDHYKKALDLSPDHGEAFLGIGVIRDLQGKIEDSLVFLEKAIKTDAENPTYWHVYAEALKKAELYSESEEAFQTRMELDVLNEQMWADFADLYWVMKNPQLALETIDKGLEFIPGDDLLLARKTVYLTVLAREPLATQVFIEAYKQYGSSVSEEIKSYFPLLNRYPILNELMDLHP